MRYPSCTLPDHFHVVRLDTLIMIRVIGSKIINLAALRTIERATFGKRLYELHCRIFDGVDEATFYAYVINSPAQWTRIKLFINARGETVGYCAVHRFAKQMRGRPCTIFRAEAGLLREYRGRSRTLWFGFAEAIKYRLQHPLCSLYYLGTFVHPGVYSMFSRYFQQYYPRHDQPVPESTAQFMSDLADAFHLEKVSASTPLVRKVGWITREAERDRAFWRTHPSPAVHYYITANPGYVCGQGLVTLVPLSFSNISASALHFLRHKIRHSLSSGDSIPNS